tara:strand:+ start:947 stop:1150 length:204 start_codon:yes stop_codon:yes gene_type:complete
MPYKDPEDRKAKQKEYYEANKDKRKEYAREYSKARYTALKEVLGDTKLVVKISLEPSSTPQCPDSTS